MLFDDSNIVNVYIKSDNKNTNNTLVDAQTGLIKGNMFKDEYSPYLNYQPPKLIAKTEKEELMLKLYETDFALHDLNLYLDLHPNDQSIYEKFKKYVDQYNYYKSIFEKNYGQLDLESGNDAKYRWNKFPWPWDKDGGSLYV